MKVIKVLIAENSDCYIEGLVKGLKPQPGVSVCGIARTGQEALDLIREDEPEVVLMDIRMPRMDGIEATGIIKKEYPHIKVIALSSHYERERVMRMRDAGAVGYIYKHTEPSQIAFYIRNADFKPFFYSGAFEDEWFDGAPRQTVPQLEEKDVRLLQLLCEGLKMDDIAQRMFAAKSTVEVWKKTLKAKLGVRTSEGLVRFAIAHGLVKKP